MVREFHIVTVGNSLLRHWLDHENQNTIPMHDHGYWSSVVDNPGVLENILSFLETDPSQFSAEVRSLEGYLKRFHRHPSDLCLYLIGSQTPSNDVVRSVLLQHFKMHDYEIFDPQTVPGYHPIKPSESAENSFQKGLALLLDHCVKITRHVRSEYHRICINATGGYKAHVIVAGLTAFITGATLYYIHEEFQEIIVYPPLFYYPSQEELALFNAFAQNSFSCDAIPDEMLKRWIDYRMVECIFKNGEPVFHVTPKGQTWLSFFHHLTPEQEA